jgi:hypothetical protein
MELTKEQFDKISGYLPRQRGNVRVDNHKFVKYASVYHGKLLQMEVIAKIFRRLAYYLYAHESLEQQRRFAAGLRGSPKGRDNPNKNGDRLPRQHNCQGSSRRNGCFKKEESRASVDPRGGLTTKIYMVAASDRSAVIFSQVFR